VESQPFLVRIIAKQMAVENILTIISMWINQRLNMFINVEKIVILAGKVINAILVKVMEREVHIMDFW